jgi:hypothetical protein
MSLELDNEGIETWGRCRQNDPGTCKMNAEQNKKTDLKLVIMSLK